MSSLTKSIFTSNEFRKDLINEHWGSAGVAIESVHGYNVIGFNNDILLLSSEPFKHDGITVRVVVNTPNALDKVSYVGYTTKRMANRLMSMDPVAVSKAVFKCLNPNLLKDGIVHTVIQGIIFEECELETVEDDRGMFKDKVTGVINSIKMDIDHDLVFPCSVIQQVSTSVGGAEALYKNKPFDRLIIVDGTDVVQHNSSKECGLNYVVTISKLN